MAKGSSGKFFFLNQPKAGASFSRSTGPSKDPIELSEEIPGETIPLQIDGLTNLLNHPQPRKKVV